MKKMKMFAFFFGVATVLFIGGVTQRVAQAAEANETSFYTWANGTCYVTTWAITSGGYRLVGRVAETMYEFEDCNESSD